MIFKVLLIPVVVISVCLCQSTFDVNSYGADKTGAKSSADAVKQAMAAAVKNKGGTISFPKGTYLVGPIVMESDITLDIDSGTTVKFSDTFSDYKDGQALISSSGADKITIKGKGTLDGQGSKWWSEFNKNSSFKRPVFIEPQKTTNILIQDVTVKNSPQFHINPKNCQHVTISGVTVESPSSSPNTDGIDPSSCSDVHITNCQISVGDDCIAVKSGNSGDKPTENLVISGCTMKSGHSGVAFGSTIGGGIKNVTIQNCNFNGPQKGFAIKSSKGRGGTVSGITVKNITVSNIEDDAILLTCDYSTSGQGKNETGGGTPSYHDITIEDFKGSSKKNTITFIGLKDSEIHDITLKNIQLSGKNKANYTYTSKITEDNVKITTS